MTKRQYQLLEITLRSLSHAQSLGLSASENKVLEDERREEETLLTSRAASLTCHDLTLN